MDDQTLGPGREGAVRPVSVPAVARWAVTGNRIDPPWGLYECTGRYAWSRLIAVQLGPNLRWSLGEPLAKARRVGCTRASEARRPGTEPEGCVAGATPMRS